MKWVGLLFLGLFSQTAIASDAVVSSDLLYTVWIAVCCFLVLFMQVGFLLLEGGLVRSKNTVNVILKNFTDVGLGSVGYWLIGFGLMFGVSYGGLFGTTSFAPSPSNSSDTLGLLYNMMFAATAGHDYVRRRGRTFSIFALSSWRRLLLRPSFTQSTVHGFGVAMMPTPVGFAV